MCLTSPEPSVVDDSLTVVLLSDCVWPRLLKVERNSLPGDEHQNPVRPALTCFFPHFVTQPLNCQVFQTVHVCHDFHKAFGFSCKHDHFCFENSLLCTSDKVLLQKIPQTGPHDPSFVSHFELMSHTLIRDTGRNQLFTRISSFSAGPTLNSDRQLKQNLVFLQHPMPTSHFQLHSSLWISAALDGQKLTVQLFSNPVIYGAI